jgi:peptide/nickel transport system substrate-binding protein
MKQCGKVLVALLLATALAAPLFSGGQTEVEDSAQPEKTTAAGKSTVAEAIDSTTFIDPNIPDSWYEAPKSASQWGIRSFNESPILAARVKQGVLPPVEDRLPVEPPVIETYAKVGKYGGDVVVWGTSLNWGSDLRYFNIPPAAGHPAPDGSKMLPHLVEDWVYTDQGKTLTIYLREGLKWSDGHPFTSADYTGWWKHVANNATLTAVAPPDRKPIALLDVSAVDDYTVVFKYDKANPRQMEFGSQNNMVEGIAPFHFLKNYHPAFVPEKQLVAAAKDLGLDRWDEYYGRMVNDSQYHPEWEAQRPILRPYVAVEATETYLIVERNPYYPFVDQEGNQLPYIDTIRTNLANSSEMAATKAATGEATLCARYTRAEDIPLYKRNEQKEDYTTLIWHRAYGSDIAIRFNMTHNDPNLRKIFTDARFRRAMSVAINREDINNKVYYGQAVPMQSTVTPTNTLFETNFATAYAQFDPAQAEDWLDEMGMVDTDGDGIREQPNGDKFNPTLIYCKMGPVDPTAAMELVRGDWLDVGVDIQLKFVSRELHDTTYRTNEGDCTIWTNDMVTDLTFGDPWHIAKFAAPGTNPTHNPWPAYANWYTTDGETGEEPTEEVKKIIELSEVLATHPDEKVRADAGRELLEIHADQLWTVGTVGLGPQPIIISNKLKNVPEKGLWDWGLRYMKTYNPMQFYMED